MQRLLQQGMEITVIAIFRRFLTKLLSIPLILFVRRLVSDSTLGLSPEARDYLNRMKIGAGSVYGDRFCELKQFWGISDLGCISFFIKQGWPFSPRLQGTLMKQFEGHISPSELMDSYRRTEFHYTANLMLSMDRAEWLIPFIPDLKVLMANKQIRVLEYGCGVSDFGLLLAGLGAKVTILDLDTRRLQFARWRYEVRGFSCETIRVENTESLPTLPPAAFDLVIATEILEHVRNPLALLKSLTSSLAPEGFFFCSMGNEFEREIGGDHLEEAAKIGNSEDYKQYFNDHYRLYAVRDEHPWLFQSIL
jgi:2-polyprenyl-3-methyl-5-hydroxy-6-metoxy-1,4-benzoquinol methylase